MSIGRAAGAERQQCEAEGAAIEKSPHAFDSFAGSSLLSSELPGAVERPSMQKLLGTIAAAATLLIAGASPSWADPDKDESGHGRGEYKEEYKYDYRTGEEKYEWKSGNCKYERKRDGGSYKEEYKCAGYPRYAGGPPPWAPAHGYRRDEYRDYGLAAPPLDLGVGRCSREVIGKLLGGAAGAAAGSQIGDGRGRLAAIVAGTIVGFIAGGEVGRSMDRADALCMDQALEHAGDGETITWATDRQHYAVRPEGSFQTVDGRYCREYQASSTVGNDTVQTYGTACRQPDGSWQIVN
jgi:surface antigen